MTDSSSDIQQGRFNNSVQDRATVTSKSYITGLTRMFFTEPRWFALTLGDLEISVTAHFSVASISKNTGFIAY